jgi:hypothetical protein
MAGCDAHNKCSGGDEDAGLKSVLKSGIWGAILGAILGYLNLAGALPLGALAGWVAALGLLAVVVAAAAGYVFAVLIGQVINWFSRLKEQSPRTITIGGRVFCTGRNPWGIQPFTDGDWTCNIGNNDDLRLVMPTDLPVTAPGAVTQVDEVRLRAAPGSGLAHAFKSFNEEACRTDILHCEISSRVGSYGVVGELVGGIAGAIAGGLIGAAICAAISVVTLGLGAVLCALIIAAGILLGELAGAAVGGVVGSGIGWIVDELSDFDRLGKTIESNRNCLLFITGRWVTDTSHQHNEIHDIEAVTIIDCGIGSSASGLQVAGAVGTGRHPSGIDP